MLFAPYRNGILDGTVGTDGAPLTHGLHAPWLLGSAADSILLGGAGDDILVGAAGHDLQVGGFATAGQRELYGAALLIGNNADRELNSNALQAVLADWSVDRMEFAGLAGQSGRVPQNPYEFVADGLSEWLDVRQSD